MAIRKGVEDFQQNCAKRYAHCCHRESLGARKCERTQRTHKRELLARFSRLSPRKNEVLEYVMRGQMNKKIAYELGINERSVKCHRTSLMSKINVTSVAELVKCAIEAGRLDATIPPISL